MKQPFGMEKHEASFETDRETVTPAFNNKKKTGEFPLSGPALDSVESNEVRLTRL